MKNLVRFTGILAVAILAASQAYATVLLSDNFNSYTAGGLAGQGGWTVYNGAGTDPQVNGSGQVVINQANAPDDQISFGGIHSNDVLYAGFDVNFSTVPTGAGTYFALFKDASSFNLQSRVFAGNSGGLVQLGIQTGSAGEVLDGTFAVGTTHRVVIRFDQSVLGGPSVSTLWVDPTVEVGGTTDSTLGITNRNMTAFGLRQSGSEGVLAFDNLIIGTTFADVVPEPSTIMLLGVGLISLLAIRRRS